MFATTLEVTHSLKSLFKQTAKLLKGTERRQSMAQVVTQLRRKPMEY